MHRLERMLMSGKLDALMDENRSIKMDDDARPVVRGKWVHRWFCSNMSGYEYACSCSVCGEPTYRMSLLDKMPNFCPNCGARMEGN